MITISNAHLNVAISTLGAELRNIEDANSHNEFLWQADPQWWGRSSPVLFPIVGKVKDNMLHVWGESYKMAQHGFARDHAFSCIEQNNQSATFLLISNENTLQYYPFHFQLEIQYTLSNNRIECRWKVTNTNEREMFFSIGAHPGFNLFHPMNEYRIVLHAAQMPERMKLHQGLFLPDKTPFQSHPIGLSPNLFNDDALVFDSKDITGADLIHNNSSHAVKMRWHQFDYLGIWAPKGCDRFVCIEPWCGRADDVIGHTDIKTKPGIHVLQPGQVFESGYLMEFTC